MSVYLLLSRTSIFATLRLLQKGTYTLDVPRQYSDAAISTLSTLGIRLRALLEDESLM